MKHFDIEILKKYNKPGPRYTSYPTAPNFKTNFPHAKYIDEIIRTNGNESNSPLSIYCHIPFCDTLCYFCGCNTIISNNRERVSKYVDFLKEEIDLMLTYLNTERKVNQFHWGGGTPTHLIPEEILDLKNFINERFNFAPNAEQSCEIDPRGLTFEHMHTLKSTGFNRISFGVQDFNPVVQKAINRIQPEELTRKVVQWTKDLGFNSVNLDLIYGLPHQNVSEFEVSIDKIIDINPERIALFNFAYVPWMKEHQKLIDEKALPSAEEKLEIFEMAITKLTDAGYVFIGMDHFAKEDDELTIALREKKLQRNFQGYTTNAGADLYAFGLTSISQHGRTYAQNHKTEKEYFSAIDKGFLPISKGYILSEDDLLRRKVIMKIMCDFQLNYSEIENEFQINFKEYFKSSLEKLDTFLNDQLLIFTDNGFKVTEKGIFVIRNIAICFDAFFELKKQTGKFSKTL